MILSSRQYLDEFEYKVAPELRRKLQADKITYQEYHDATAQMQKDIENMMDDIEKCRAEHDLLQEKMDKLESSIHNRIDNESEKLNEYQEKIEDCEEKIEDFSASNVKFQQKVILQETKVDNPVIDLLMELLNSFF